MAFGFGQGRSLYGHTYVHDQRWVANKEKYLNNVKESIPEILKEVYLEINQTKTEEFRFEQRGNDQWKIKISRVEITFLEKENEKSRS